MQKPVSHWKLSLCGPQAAARVDYAAFLSLTFSVSLSLPLLSLCHCAAHKSNIFDGIKRAMKRKSNYDFQVRVRLQCVCVWMCLQSSEDAINTDMHKYILIFLSLSLSLSFLYALQIVNKN